MFILKCPHFKADWWNKRSIGSK